MTENEYKDLLTPYLNEEEIKIFLASTNSDTYNKGCILNTNKVSIEELIENTNNKEDLSKNYLLNDSFLNFTNKSDLSKSIYHHSGAIYIVDPSSIEVIFKLTKELKPNSIVLDMCASPGGKTILLALLRKDITIVSNDINLKRNFVLQSNINRLGLTNVIITNNTIDDFSYLENKFDAIILDVPCSGIGMSRKKEKMELDYSKEKVENLIPIQKELINKGSKLIKKDGYLVYSTCSYNILENEFIVKDLLENSKEYEHIELTIPNTFTSKYKVGTHIIPPFYKGEGHYVCYLKRTDCSSSNSSFSLKEKEKYKIDNFIFDAIKYKNNYYLVSFFYKELEKLNIRQIGININNTFTNSKIQINHFLSHVNNLDLCQTIQLNKTQAYSYLQGNQIKLEEDIKTNSKLVLLKYKNTTLGFGKKVNNLIQNYYPKELRIKN